MNILTLRTRQALARGEGEAALEFSRQAIELLKTMPADESFNAWALLLRYRALRAAQRGLEGRVHLRRAYERVMQVADHIHSDSLRRGWLENVLENREVIKDFDALTEGASPKSQVPSPKPQA